MPTRRPVIIEVRPDNSMSLSPPASPSKAVRFPAVPSEIITGITRPLSPTEAWSLYHFEIHARDCSACDHPYYTLTKGGSGLCSHGKSLARDVIEHVYHRDGQIYSTIPEQKRDIRVEIPHGYDKIIGLLKGIDRRQRSSKQTKPHISYEQPRAPAVQPVTYTTTIPARSRSHREPKYDTIIIGGGELKRSRSEKRGSLYNDENILPRPRKEYTIEVRAPQEESRRRRHHRND